MFNNIGGKIKVLAKVLCWVGIAFSVIMGIIILAGGETVHVTINGEYSSVSNVPAGILTIVLGSLFSWIGSFLPTTYRKSRLLITSSP